MRRKHIIKLAEQGADFSDISLSGITIYDIDFTRVHHLTAENWLSAQDLWGCKLPAGMDFSGVSLQGRYLNYVDFSQVRGLTAKNWLSAGNKHHCTLPRDLDFSGIFPVMNNLSGIDFSHAKGLTLSLLLNNYLDDCILPENLPIDLNNSTCKLPSLTNYVHIKTPSGLKMRQTVEDFLRYRAGLGDSSAQRFLLMDAMK